MSKIAVVLSGCGYLDGTEINEAVAVLWALSAYKAEGVEVHCFAPDEDQYHVIDHISGEEATERRNILRESARIARGKVEPLTSLSAHDFDAVIMPGGFGAAKNLSSFARDGSAGSVHEGLAEIIRDFHKQQKPIGAACIAPAVVALSLKQVSLNLTVGETSDASREIEKLGHTHHATALTGITYDEANRIVTTPAFMYDDALLCDLFEGASNMVSKVVALVNEPTEASFG